MIVIDTMAKHVPTSTREVLTFIFQPIEPPIESVVEITPRGRRVFSEHEALAILFPDAESRRALRTATNEQQAYIREKIRRAEVNPIRGWRMIRGMDQTQLSRETGILQPNLARMERLGASTSIRSLRRIAKALEVDVKELLP